MSIAGAHLFSVNERVLETAFDFSERVNLDISTGAKIDIASNFEDVPAQSTGLGMLQLYDSSNEDEF